MKNKFIEVNTWSELRHSKNGYGQLFFIDGQPFFISKEFYLEHNKYVKRANIVDTYLRLTIWKDGTAPYRNHLKVRKWWYSVR